MGYLPLACQLGKMGATLFTVANHLLAVNETIAKECKTIVGVLTHDDAMLGYFLQTRRIHIICFDDHLPQVKLKEVLEACNDAVAGVNLLILVGMGPH